MYPRKLARRKLPIRMINTILNKEIEELMEYRQVMKIPKYCKLYERAYSKELRRLAQGIPGQSEGTGTLLFIEKSSMLVDRWRHITYGRVVVNYRPEKDDPYRVRLCVGCDRLHCPWDCGTPTVEMLTVKLLWNSIVATPNAKFISIDIKDFYLNTPKHRYEYKRLKSSHLPDNVIRQYNLRENITKDGYVRTEICRGMYGIRSAVILAQRHLKND